MDQYQPPQQPQPYIQPTPLPPVPPAAEPPSKKGLILKIVGAFLAVILVAGGVVFGLALTLGNEDREPPRELTFAEQVVLDAREIIDRPIQPESGVLTISGVNEEAPDFARPSQQSSDGSYAVFAETAYGIVITPVELTEFQPVETALKEYLGEKGFQQTAIIGENESESYTRYAASQAICTVYRSERPGAASADTEVFVTLGCSDQADYQESLRAFGPVSEATPAEALPASFSDVAIFDTLSERPSAVEGIETVSVVIRNYPFGEIGLLATYYKEVDEDWVFVGISESFLPCTTFNTDELQAIFEGTTCLDGTTERQL